MLDKTLDWRSFGSSYERTLLRAKFSERRPRDFSLLRYLFSGYDPRQIERSLRLLSMVSYLDEFSEKLRYFWSSVVFLSQILFEVLYFSMKSLVYLICSN